MLQKHSVKIHQHTTSISLEKEFWDELKAIAKLKKTTISALITEIDTNRSDENLCSALRVFILNEVKKRNHM